MTEKRFYTDGQYVMQDGEVYVICNGEHNADVVATALNELLDKNEELKREKERYKQLSEIRNENINNRILTLKEFINNCEDEKVKNTLEDFFYSEVKEYDLAKENRKLKKENGELKKEKEFWKGDSCNCSNYLSILSMDCQIVQEAIYDLKKVIDVDTEASKLLNELNDKFDKLNQHRIRHTLGDSE